MFFLPFATGIQAGASESTGLQLEHDSSDDGGCDTGRADIDSDAMDVDEDEVEVVEVDDLSPNGVSNDLRHLARVSDVFVD